MTGPLAMRLTRIHRDHVKTLKDPRIECSFRAVTRKTQGKTAKAISNKGDKKSGKRKRQSQSSEEEEEEPEDDGEMDDFIIEEDEEEHPANQSSRPLPESIPDSDPESEPPGWTYSMREPPLKKRRASGQHSAHMSKPITIDTEVIELSDSD
jgi:hypothetical protein